MRPPAAARGRQRPDCRRRLKLKPRARAFPLARLPMPSRLLVAGLDARSLIVAAPVLQRDGHQVQEKASASDLLEDLTGHGAQMVVLGARLPDLGLAETIRLIRGSEATREV